MKKTILATAILSMISSVTLAASDDVTGHKWDAAGATEIQIQQRIEFLLAKEDPRSFELRLQDLPIRARYQDAIVIDSLATGAVGFPMAMSVGDYNEMLNFSYDYGYTFLSTTLSNGTDKNFQQTLDRLQATKTNNEAKGHILVKGVEDIYKAKAEGRGAYDFHLQGAAQIESKEQLAHLQEHGLNRVNFTYNTQNQYASGMMQNKTNQDKGLTKKGVELVKQMNDLGIVVDCSHSSDKTCIDAAKVSTKPVILSHTNPRALMDIERNASDEAILAVAKTGGVACTNMVGGFLNKDFKADPQAVAKAVNYTAELAGKEATCMGVDYLHNYADALHWIITTPEKFPPSQGYGSPSEVGRPGDIWAVVKVLEENYDWNEKEIRGFLGENLIRVYKATW